MFTHQLCLGNPLDVINVFNLYSITVFDLHTTFYGRSRSRIENLRPSHLIFMGLSGVISLETFLTSMMTYNVPVHVEESSRHGA